MGSILGDKAVVAMGRKVAQSAGKGGVAE